MSIIIFIIALAVLILVHEFGHFIVAKKAGIRVHEFGLGFPPKVLSKQWGETLYTLNAIPFGGFVKIFGEDPHVETISEADKPRSMFYQPKWIQALVLLAGVTMNFLFAWLLISLGFMIGLPTPGGTEATQDVTNVHLMVISTLPGSPAEKAGLLSGDKITLAKSENETVVEKDLTPESLSALITRHQTPVSITYTRGVESHTTTIEPANGVVEGKRAIGISMDMVGTRKLSFFKAFYEGAVTTLLITKETVIGLGIFFWNIITFHSDFSQVAGPVGIAGSVGQARTLGFSYLLSFIALISINLAVINLVPFPALDGGRLFLILIEVVIRRPINPNVVRWVNIGGFAFLLILMLVITGHDILKLL